MRPRGGEPVAVAAPRELELKTPSDLGGSGLLSRAVTFSMAVGHTGRAYRHRRVALLDWHRAPLLVTGDFNREMAHWTLHPSTTALKSSRTPPCMCCSSKASLGLALLGHSVQIMRWC